MIISPHVREQLTAGSDLDRTAVQWQGPVQAPTEPLSSGAELDRAQLGSPWPTTLPAGYKQFTGYRPNSFRNVSTRNLPANYGSQSSRANYGFTGHEFPGSLGLYPGPVPSAKRPMWNNLTSIVWGLRVVDTQSQAQTAELISTYPPGQVAPMDYTPSGSASLRETLL